MGRFGKPRPGRPGIGSVIAALLCNLRIDQLAATPHWRNGFAKDVDVLLGRIITAIEVHGLCLFTQQCF